MASIGISDVVTASVYSEKTRMKKLMMKMIIIIIITIMSKRIDGFSLASEIDFRKSDGRLSNLMLYTAKSS